MTYPTALNSLLVPFMIFNFHGLKNPCNSEAVNFLNSCEHILLKGQYFTAQGNGTEKYASREYKIQTRGNFESYVVQVLLSDHNEPCACVLTVRPSFPSRDSAVNINITVFTETHFHEPRHEHLSVGIRHIVVTFAILWPSL